MSIQVVCPHCRSTVSAPEKAAGRKVRCPSCHGYMVLPDAPPVAEASATPDVPNPLDFSGGEQRYERCTRCRRQVASDAQFCPSCGAPQFAPPEPTYRAKSTRPRKAGKVWGCLTVLVTLPIIVCAFGSLLPRGDRNTGERFAAADDAERILATYGRPDVDDTTAYDEPRPLIVMRWFTYKRQAVTFHFVPAGKTVDDPPPYDRWKLVVVQDWRTKESIGSDEADRRLRR